MINIFTALFALSFLSFSASAQQCHELLGAEDSSAIESVMTKAGLSKEVIKGDLAFAENYLKQLEDESEKLKRTRRTSELDKLIKSNRKLREAKGGYAKLLNSRRAMRILRLKNALRDGDQARVFDVIDDTMLVAEQKAIDLGILQRKIVQKNTQLEEAVGFSNFFKRINLSDEIYLLQGKVKKLMWEYHEVYALYRAFRATFEWQMKNGSEDVRKQAEYIYSKVGVANNLELGNIGILELKEGERPSVDFMRAEFAASDFGDGTPRYLSGRGLNFKLELENKELKKIRFVNLRRFGLFTAFDLIAQRLRIHAGGVAVGRVLARPFDILSRGLQNDKALRSHFAELESINIVRDSRKFKRFLTVLTNHKEAGFLKSEDFDFLTSFARAEDYKGLWERMIYTMALEPLDATHLVEKFAAVKSKIKRVKLKLDLVRSKREVAREEDLAALKRDEGKFISELSKLEISKKEVLKLIKTEMATFLSLDMADQANVAMYPTMLSHRNDFDLMIKAKQRSAKLGPLSVEFSPGSGTRYTAYTAAIFIVSRQVLVWTGGMDLLDAQLMEWFSVQIPEIEDILATFSVENLMSGVDMAKDKVDLVVDAWNGSAGVK